MDALYVRQSIDKKDSISIEGQVEACKKEIVGNKEHKIYEDKGFSGKDTNRPAFEEMVNDIKRRMIGRVIVYKLDRISRSTLDFANMVNLFREYDVEFISSTEKFDTSTPMGKAMLQLIMVFAELERDTIQIRIKDNYYFRGKKGYFLGGRTPFGFSKTKTEINGKKTSALVDNPNQSFLVTEMYDLYATTNMSLNQISSYINEKGYLSADNKKWDSGKISRMLKSPLYVKADADVYLYYKGKKCIFSNDLSDFVGQNGCYLFGKREPNERKYTNVENHILTIAPHKGLIDSWTWLRCQYKLDSNKQLKNSGKGKHSWLSGVAKCGHCKYAVSVVVSNKKYKYLSCRGRVNLKVCEGFSKAIRVEDIESVVEIKLSEEIQKHERLSKSQVAIKKEIGSNKQKLQLIGIENQIENLVNQIAEGNNVIMKYMNEKINKLENEKCMLLEELKKNTIEECVLDNESIFKKIKLWDKLSLEEKKEICATYINKVFIKEESIEIDWRLKA